MVDDYNLEKLVSKGGFGDIYIGSKKGSQEKYAIKKSALLLYQKDKKHLDNEILILKDTNHPNIIRLYDVKTDSNFIYIITEYCNGGNLEQFLEKYLEANNKALPEE